jgi:hypothetical protein
MDIDQYKYNQSMLKIARIELKERSANIDILEHKLYLANAGARILIAVIIIQFVGMVSLLIGVAA